MPNLDDSFTEPGRKNTTFIENKELKKSYSVPSLFKQTFNCKENEVMKNADNQARAEGK